VVVRNVLTPLGEDGDELRHRVRLGAGGPSRRPEVVLRPVKPRTLFLPTGGPSGLTVVPFRVSAVSDADCPAMRVLADVPASPRMAS